MRTPQLVLDLHSEMIVDNFAGGGGASTGIELALGRCTDLAINHCALALSMHEANHPQTRHLREDVFKVDPVAATNGRPVGLAWFSPDCTHFSKAKGGKPRSKKIRGLAWVMVKWAAKVKPRVMVLENVEEFKTWGPLLDDGSPCPRRKGKTFKSFIKRLNGLGYAVEWRELRCCEYGAPTIRKRLFLIARCDGKPIVWPARADWNPRARRPGQKLKAWRTAAECIDWWRACPSIFLTPAEARVLGVKRPLAEATQRRIARGMFKYVIHAKEPFIVPLTHQGGDRVESVAEPFKTITGAHRGERALVTPFLTEHANGSTQRTFDAAEPLRTQCAGVKGGHFALVAPHLVGAGGPSYGGKPTPCDQPMKTVLKENHSALVTAFLAKHFSGEQVHAAPPGAPMPTVTSRDHNALVAAHLMVNTTGHSGGAAREPMPTVPTGGHHALVTSHLSKFYGTATGQPHTEPMHSVTAQAAGGHFAEVRAFLVKYYGNEREGHPVNEPLHTVTTKDRLGLVTVAGQEYRIDDIGMRMLVPRELFRAQGFPDSYIIAPVVERLVRGKPARGPLTADAQVRMCGNSVPPPVVAAIVHANAPDLSLARALDARQNERR